MKKVSKKLSIIKWLLDVEDEMFWQQMSRLKEEYERNIQSRCKADAIYEGLQYGQLTSLKKNSPEWKENSENWKYW